MLSLKTDVNVPTVKNKKKTGKNLFLLASWKPLQKEKDPEPDLCWQLENHCQKEKNPDP
jgi:hypothetical protein